MQKVRRPEELCPGTRVTEVVKHTWDKSRLRRPQELVKVWTSLTSYLAVPLSLRSSPTFFPIRSVWTSW